MASFLVFLILWELPCELIPEMDHLQLQVSLDAMFDVQIKRIHEYKRQLLNILSIIHRYDCIKVFWIMFQVTRFIFWFRKKFEFIILIIQLSKALIPTTLDQLYAFFYVIQFYQELYPVNMEQPSPFWVKATDAFTKVDYLATCSEVWNFSPIASPFFNIFLSL